LPLGGPEVVDVGGSPVVVVDPVAGVGAELPVDPPAVTGGVEGP
jgi:hypothetical protein